MSVSVASTAIKAYASGSTIVIDKPTGLAVGDLMVALVHKDDGNVGTCSLTGWTAIDSYDDSAISGDYMFSLYKIADSADAAASNFTFTLGETKVTGGAILRITGFNNIAPINQHGVGTDGTSNTSVVFSAGAVTPTENCLIIFAIFEDAGAITNSAYAITNNNPSWTEVVDQSDGSNVTMAVAWAYRPELTSTGNYSATASSSTRAVGFLIAIGNAVVEVNDIVTVSDITPISSPTLTTSETITVTDELEDISANNWTNQSKNSSVWTNTTKN